MLKGQKQVQTAIVAAREESEERQWAVALDASARLHLALGQPVEAYENSLQALELLEANPWLPKPHTHRYTHFLALCALGRRSEALGHLQRANDHVMLVADRLTDDSLRQSWLQNVRVNREILADWRENS